MKLEHQVVSLDLAKRLKELGVKQESVFEWADYGNSVGLITECGDIANFQSDHYYTTDLKGRYCAFTAAELGEMLPPLISKKNRKQEWTIEVTEKFLEADTEIDARAKMLIYLLENKLIQLPA